MLGILLFRWDYPALQERGSRGFGPRKPARWEFPRERWHTTDHARQGGKFV